MRGPHGGGRRRMLCIAAMCSAGAALTVPGPAAAGEVVTFGYTGDEQRFVVPAGVRSIGVVATGAPGAPGQLAHLGNSVPGPGGVGATVASRLAVTPGQVLYARVGGPGAVDGFNGGGAGGTASGISLGSGGRGGGATDLRTCSALAAVCPDGAVSSAASRLVVAGGGGGGAGAVSGFGVNSGAGGSAATDAPTGGDGEGGTSEEFSGKGAGGGLLDGPGLGGEGRNGAPPGVPGQGVEGGWGGTSFGSGHGGGGGGGWFGGGGGGAGFGGGGGGAGSSHGPSGTVYRRDAAGVPSLMIYFAAPRVTTGAASGATRTTADLHGVVNPQAQDTSWHFEYGTDGSYGSVAPLADGDAGSGTEGVAVRAELDGLSPDTTYHYRLVATNGAGTTAGIERTFRTAPATVEPSVARPSVATGGATGITQTGAVLAARVTPNGGATTWHIEYGRTTGDVVAAPLPGADVGPGSVPVTVSVPVGDLVPGSTYHYRVVAVNAAGIAEGAFRTFVTLERPAPAPAPAPASGSEPPSTPPAGAPAKLRITITPPVMRARAGRFATLRVRVANRGGTAATGGRVRVSLPGRLRAVAAPRGCSVRPRVVVCPIAGALEAGAVRAFTVRTRARTPGRASVSAAIVPTRLAGPVARSVVTVRR